MFAQRVVCCLDWCPHRHPPGILPLLLGLYPRCQPVPCALTHLRRPSQGFRHARGQAEAREFFFGRQRCEEGSVRGREALTHGGNFFLLHVWSSLRQAAWGDEQKRQIPANEAAPTPVLRDCFRSFRTPPKDRFCASLIIARFRERVNQLTIAAQSE